MTINRSNAGMLVAGLILIAMGVLSLLGQAFSRFPFWHFLWPFSVIGFGALFFVGMLAGGRQWAFMAIPGSIVTVNGVLLLFQNLTADWVSWSYSWTITIVSVGLGIYLMGMYEGNEYRRQAGMNVMRIGAILFIVFGLFFGLFFSFLGSRQYFFPILLIVVGLYLVASRTGLLNVWKRGQPQPPQDPNIPR